MGIQNKPRLAVVGSGIAGLSAAWLLRDRFHVSLFEKAPRLGIGQKGVDIQTPAGHLRIDVPIRVFSNRYYPNLYKLCRKLNVSLRHVNNESSFSNHLGETYFRYFNWQLGSSTVSYIKPRLRQLGWTVTFLKDYARFLWDLRQGAFQERYGSWTLGEYFRRQGYQAAFTDQFFIPLFAAIATCDHSQMKAYPAHTILELFASFGSQEPMRRWIGGTTELEEALARSVDELCCGTEVRSLHRDAQGVTLITADGKSRVFDRVVVALQANQAARILSDGFATERQLLECIPYVQTSMSVHQDERLMPRLTKDWASVNYLIRQSDDLPVATLWINRSEPDFAGVAANYFQSLNPPELVKGEICRTTFERPIVTHRSLKAVEALSALQQVDSNRQIYFCGAYLARKLPLLENGVVSALQVAQSLGAKMPVGLVAVA
jgi:predicted NAD/FAD-binding protein